MLEVPHEVREICDEEVEEKFREECKDKVLVGAKRWCLPKRYVPRKEIYYNFKVRQDDVWIMGYPRSGTTMTQEIIWLIANDLDFETAREVAIQERVPFFEWGMITGYTAANTDANNASGIVDGNIQGLINTKSRRFIKTHFPFSLLPQNLLQEGGKVIYVARNPKDVIVSQYNFYDLIRSEGYKLTFKEHCELFMKGLHRYCPYFEHLKQAWEIRHQENVMFIFYEDIMKDKPTAMRNIAKFLGKSLSDKDIDDLNAHVDIKNFKKNKSLNNSRLEDLGLTNKNRKNDFVRKGIIGDWKNYADEELDKEVTQWIEDGIRGTGISFSYK